MATSPNAVKTAEQPVPPAKALIVGGENAGPNESKSPTNVIDTNEKSTETSKDALLQQFKRLIVAVLDAMAQDRLASQTNDGSFIFSSTPLHAFANSENVTLDSFKVSGGIRIIVLALKKHGSCSPVVHNGCLALITLMTLDRTTGADILAAGGIESVVAALSANAKSDSEEALVAALKLLRNLAQAAEHREKAFREGGIAAIMAVMREHAASPRTLSHAALLLANLAFGNAEIKEAVGAQGALTAIAAGMRDHGEDHGMAARGSLALRNLCYGLSSNCELAGEARAADALVGALRRFAEDREVAHQSCVALANMSNESEANRSRIVAAGGGPALVALLQRYPVSATVADDTLSVLRNIAVGSEQAQIEIGTSGGVECVALALERFRTDARVVSKGCAALRYLCFLEANRELAGECNALQNVVGAMQVQMESASTVEDALLAIGNSTFGNVRNKELVGECGGVKTIIQAIEQHRLTVAIQAHGCRVLRNLTDGVEENRRQAVEHRAITAGVFAMMGYVDNASVQEQACAMLLNIAASNDYLPQLEQADVRRLAEKALATHTKNRGVHLQAGMLLDRLNGFDVHGIVGGDATVAQGPSRGRLSRGRLSRGSGTPSRQSRGSGTPSRQSNGSGRQSRPSFPRLFKRKGSS